MNQPVCPINLGSAQKKLRLVLGTFSFILAAGISLLFVFFDAAGSVRLAVFFPYFLSMLLFLQAKERTCVVFAYQNVKDMGTGQEPVTDAASSGFLKRKAKKIVIQSAFIAILLTAATFLIR